MSGAVTPDTYRVEKRNYSVIDSRISEKLLAYYPVKEGGIRQESLSQEQQNQIVLSNNEILALTKMVCQVESHYGNPHDIELAFAGGNIYLLQSRPITSLYPADELASPDVWIYF